MNEDETPVFMGDRPRSWRGYALRYMWSFLSLAWLIPAIAAVIQSRMSTSERVVTLTSIGVFGAVWLWLMVRAHHWSLTRRWGILLLLAALATVFTVTTSGDGVGFFIYVSVAAGFALPERFDFRTVIGVTLLSIATGLAAGATPTAIAQIALLVFMIGGSMAFTGRLISTNYKLRAAREEIARLAVNEERLRFARDLHDLLGHSLSAIALKTELAGRLVHADPERAERELSEIEALARQSLREVREAVAGYRQPSLQDELRNAREVLSAAGIECLIEGSPSVPPAAEAALAWTIREGVTNVVRHSRAHYCTIRFRDQDGQVGVEVLDDGNGAGLEPGRPGNGLRGLAERIAAEDGLLDAGPLPAGGFRLTVTLPVQAGARLPEGAR